MLAPMDRQHTRYAPATPPNRRRTAWSALACALAFAFALPACKRSNPARPRVDGARAPATIADASSAASAIAWDGSFGAAMTPSDAVVVAVASLKSAAVRVLDVVPGDAHAPRTTVIALGAPLASAPSVAAFADGTLALVVVERLGDPPTARMLSAARAPVGAAAAIGSDWCNTDDALYFVDRAERRLRRWEHGEGQPRAADGPSFAAHATPLCGTHAAFVLEPKASGFDVVAGAGFARAPIAGGVDPASGGTYAVYVAGDAVGLVALLADGALSWTTVTKDGKVTVHPVARRISASETLVAADGTEDRVSVLFQHDGKNRCGEDETPPAYDVLELGGSPRDVMSAMPPFGCEGEGSQPDIQQMKTGALVRWFEWQDEGHAKRLRFWSRVSSDAGAAGDGGVDAGAGARPVPADAVLLDCGDAECLAVGRDGADVRLVAVP
jgi:hypothetical protein